MHNIIESKMFDFERVRKFCVRRTEALWPLCFRLCIVGLCISVSMGILFSLCSNAGPLYGVELGLLSFLPMLFLVGFFFILALGFVEITRRPKYQVPFCRVIPQHYICVPDGCLPLPFSPPRFRLA